MLPADDALVLAAQKGDRKALDEVVRRTQGLVRWHAGRAARGNDEKFDEALSAGLHALLDAVRNYRAGKSSWANYAMVWIRARVARALEAPLPGVAWTRMPSEVPVEELADVLPQENVSPEEMVDLGVLTRRLYRHIDRLDEHEREVMRGLLADEERKEIGTRLGVARQTVDQRRHRAIAKLKVSMKPQHEAENER